MEIVKLTLTYGTIEEIERKEMELLSQDDLMKRLGCKAIVNVEFYNKNE